MAIILTLSPTSASAALKRGTSGTDVKNVQTMLKDLGYFKYAKTTGYYGSITEVAVKRFQKKNGLVADGVVGKITRRALLANDKKKVTSNFTLMSNVKHSNIGALDWFSKVQYIWPRGTNAIVTDVNTGKSFNLKRTYGTNHADVEPLTKKDTAIIKDLWNGWSWERRAVVVQVGKSIIAGSMAGMPHAGVDSASAEKVVSGRSCNYGRGQNLDSVKNNGVNGVMDLHFKNSRNHNTNKVKKEHQDMVIKAAKYIEKHLL